MTTNDKIIKSAYKVLRGELRTVNQSGLCLRFVREVCEDALYGGLRQFYGNYLVVASSRKPTGTSPHLDPWAVDLEASMKQLKLAVPFESRQPGDIIFNHDALRPFGHVGILFDTNTIIENINPAFRATSVHFPRFVSLTPVSRWQQVTLVARLP